MRKIIVIVLVVCLLGGIGFRLWQQRTQNQQMTKEAGMMGGKAFGSSVTAVKTQKAARQDIYDLLELVGEINAQTEISVQPRISGRITEILANEGDYVKAGQAMAVLDNETALLELKQAEADLNTAKANLRNSENTLARAKTELERYKELLANKYVSQKSYETVEDSYLAAQVSEESYRAKLVSAEKEYDLAVIDLNRTQIIAPKSGYVLTKSLAIGQNVSSSTTVYTMASLDKIKVKFSVDQKQAAKVQKGLPIIFETDAYPDEEFRGYISENAPLYDSTSRAVTVSSSLTNNNMKLLPGMFGTVSMVVGESKNALVVPSEAIVLKNGKNCVFTIENDLAKLKEVTIGISSEKEVEILSGIEEGEAIIIVGQTTLRDGGAIEILNDNSEREPKEGAVEGAPGGFAGKPKVPSADSQKAVKGATTGNATKDSAEKSATGTRKSIGRNPKANASSEQQEGSQKAEGSK